MPVYATYTIYCIYLRHFYSNHFISSCESTKMQSSSIQSRSFLMVLDRTVQSCLELLFLSLCMKHGHCGAHIFLMYRYHPLHNPFSSVLNLSYNSNLIETLSTVILCITVNLIIFCKISAWQLLKSFKLAQFRKCFLFTLILSIAPPSLKAGKGHESFLSGPLLSFLAVSIFDQ